MVFWNWQGRPSPSAEPDDNVGGEYVYVWGTNVNIPDVLRAIRRFLNNYRLSADDLDSKYIQLIQEVGNLTLIWALKCSSTSAVLLMSCGEFATNMVAFCWLHGVVRLWSEKRIL
jgi:hypothetical protein